MPKRVLPRSDRAVETRWAPYFTSVYFLFPFGSAKGYYNGVEGCFRLQKNVWSVNKTTDLTCGGGGT